MKLIYILMFIVLSSVVVALPSVPSNLLDKPILQIDDCFNVSVKVKLLSGNFTPLSFKDCSLLNGSWYCDCHNVLGTYNLTLRTDKTPLDVERTYRFSISYSTYELSKFSNIMIVEDGGQYINVKGESTSDLGRDVVVVYEPYYVNVTVFVDRNVTVNNTIVQEVERIVYITNDSLIKELELNNNKLSKESYNYKIWSTIILILLIVLVIFIFYIVNKGGSYDV